MKLNDFVNLENKNIDYISVVKRENNKKRDYLFLNKELGKHYPVLGKNVFHQFNKLENELKKYINPNQKILLIGFAETATAISEYLFFKASQKMENHLNLVYYIQTTREDFNTDIPLISFEEEHSHATNQKLYYNETDIPEYDTILFIEDEITTGNTILNFINEFSKIKPNLNYIVGSLLNWQNKENKNKFKSKGIQTVSLVNGEIKNNVSKIKLNITIDKLNIKNRVVENEKITLPDTKFEPRLGINIENYKKRHNNFLLTIENELNNEGNKKLVIGTEEYMFHAIYLSCLLDGFTQSTTRSPIVCSNYKDYPIKNGSIIPSAYDSSRTNYIYNLNKYDEIVVLGDFINKEFEKNIKALLLHFSKNLKILKTNGGINVN